MRKLAVRKFFDFLRTASFSATVCKTVLPVLSDRCPVLSVCLSVTFVHCGQTVGRIKTKLGTQVGLVPVHIVLDGNPAPPPPRGKLLWPLVIFGHAHLQSCTDTKRFEPSCGHSRQYSHLVTARRNARIASALQAQCSHCNRCTSYGNSVCLSVRHTPVLCQNDCTCATVCTVKCV